MYERSHRHRKLRLGLGQKKYTHTFDNHYKNKAEVISAKLFELNLKFQLNKFINVMTNLVILITNFQLYQAMSGQFQPIPAFQPFPAISSHFKPFQSIPDTSRHFQTIPDILALSSPKSSESPKVLKNTKKYQNYQKSTIKYLKVPKNTLRYQKVPKSTQNYPKVPISYQNYSKVSKGTQKYPKVHKINQYP